MGSREKHSSKRSRDDERSKGDRVSKRRSRSASKQSNPSSQRHKRTSDIEFEMTRIAARAIRDIARYNDGLKGEIRQLAEALDAGNALDISDIKDDYLHDKVKILFDNLPQLRKKSSGSYVCRSRSSSSVMSFIAPMLEQDVSFPEPELKAFPSSNNEELNPSPPRENNPPRTSNAEKPPEPSDPVGIRPVMGPAAPPSHVLEEAAALKEQMEMEKNTIEPEGDSELIGPPPPQLEVEVEAGKSCCLIFIVDS